MPIFIPSRPLGEPKRKQGKSLGGLASHILGDVPQLGRSLLIDLPTALARGSAHTLADVQRASRGRPGELRHTAKRLGGLALGITDEIDRLTPSVGPIRWLEQQQIFGKNAKGDWDFWFKIKDEDDVEDAIEAWYEDPLISSLSLAPAAGSVTRVGSIAKLTKQIRLANPKLSKRETRKLAAAESRNPGALAVLGVKGGLKPRELTVSTPGGKTTRTVTLPRSGSPIGRGLESLYDISSKKTPIKTLSEEARGARFEKRQGRERLREQEAKVAGLARPIIDLAYRYPGIRGFLAGRKEAKPEAAALTTLLQLPKELTTKQALEAHLEARGQMLAEGVYTKSVHSSLDDLPDASKWVGTTVRVENPDKGKVWKLESVDADEGTAIVTRGSSSQVVDYDEVFPVKKSGDTYGPAFKENAPLDDDSRALIRSEMASLRRTLENPPNEAAFNQALGSLERISELVEAYGFFINGRNLSKAEREQLAARYARRKQLLVNDLTARGLIPEGMEARGYFPHFSMWRALAANWSGPVRLPSSGLVIGRPQKHADVSRAKKNDLILHQLGQVNMDPSALLYLLSMRMRYAETFAMRKDYYDLGVDLDDAPKGKGGYLIRDPDKAAQSISDRTKAELNLSDEEYAKLVRQGEDTATVLDDAENVASEPRDWLAAREGPHPDWTREDGVRWLPEHVVEARFGRRVFRGETPSMLGLANGLARLSLILSRPLRYAMSNVPSNIVMLAATNPDALLQASKLMGQAATRRLPKGVDRELLEMIRSQSGEVRATAGIPQFTTMRVRPLEKAEAGVARHSTRLGDVMGTIVDEPFRIAAWISRAKRMGLTEPEDWRRLLAAPADSDLGQARQQLRQRTRDDLLDFDSMTQWEREQATRFLFVWPYLRAATKWPFVYARERPIAAGLLTGLAEQAPDVALPLPVASAQGANEVEIAGRRFDLSQLNPLSPLMEASGTTQRLARGDVAAGLEYLTPALGLGAGLTEGNLTGKDAAWKALSILAPGGQLARNVGDNGWRDALMEEGMRFTPRKPYRFVRRDQREEMESVVAAYGNVFQNPLFARSFKGYWMYRDMTTRARQAAKETHGREKLTEAEKREILQRVWQRHFSAQGEFPSVPVSEDANDAIASIMFQLREYLAHGLPDDE